MNSYRITLTESERGFKTVYSFTAMLEQTEQPTYAYFFFTDIVGLSDPRVPTKRQIKKIEGLTSLIADCSAFKNTDRSKMLYLPTGDGMAIGFLSEPELPFSLAVELHKKLHRYNTGKFPEETLRIRIGLADGPVYLLKGTSDNINLWGEGILLARSVMDIGDDNHILLSPSMAELLHKSDRYGSLIKVVHDYEIDKEKTLLVYSAHGEDIGNPDMPKKKLYQKRKSKAEIEKMKSAVIYKNIDVTLTLKDTEKMLHYSRFYSIENISNEPIESIFHNIRTNVRKSFNDLNIRVTDESDRELKITSINFDKPFQKEFTTSFNKPIQKGEKDRSYTIEYDVEDPKHYFENRFNFSCRKYVMSFIYPTDAGYKPVVYDVKTKTNTATKSKTQPKITKIENGLLKATWVKNDVIEKQAFRLKW